MRLELMDQGGVEASSINPSLLIKARQGLTWAAAAGDQLPLIFFISL